MESSIVIEKIDITDLNVDAIVNAANSQLLKGGGVCGAIFRKAGSAELADACSKIGGCKTGSAVITPGFNLQAKYVIHAVGPVWKGGAEGEAELLYGAYERSLILAKENSCRSIAFPVISSGIYGYPKRKAFEIAIMACNDFINDNQEYSLKIIFAVLSEASKKMGEDLIYNIESYYNQQK